MIDERRNQMKLKRLKLFGDQFALSWAVCAGDVIHVAGMVGMEVDMSAPRLEKVTFPEGIEAQMRQCYKNIDYILQSVGSSLADIAEQTMFFTGDSDEATAATNVVRREVFGDLPPASATVGVAQLFDPRCRLEMKVTAYRGAGN
jgi:enamine deaminase RidA (YjgF/YER057c/UK114 family)